MKIFSLVEFSIARPKWVMLATAALTLLFLAQFPSIRTDTNPKHMLPANSDVRVWNDSVDKTFALYEDWLNRASLLYRGKVGRGAYKGALLVYYNPISILSSTTLMAQSFLSPMSAMSAVNRLIVEEADL